MRTKLFIVCVVAAMSLHVPVAADDRLYNLQHSAFMLGEQKQYPKAIELLKQALKMDPKDAWTHRHIGTMYCQMDLYKESLPYYQESLRLDPHDYDTIDGLTYSMLELKMYEPLIAICQPYLKAHPNDKECADLYERMGHALAKLNRYKESYAAYDRYFDFKPGDPNDWWRAGADFESVEAAPYLSSLLSAYRKRFPKHDGVAALGQTLRTTAQLARGEASAEKKDAFEAFISYNEEKPKVSKIFYGAVKEGLRSVPASIWQPLADADFTVLLTPYVADIKGGDTGWNRHPRGWRKGATYANVGGLYMPERKAIVVAEFQLDDHGKPEKTDDPSGTVCHELGHAYDDYLGMIYGGTAGDNDSASFSHGAMFSAAYKKDAAKLTPAARKRLEYFVQATDHAGQEELFAELFPILLNEAAYAGSDDELLRNSFPNTYALMARFLVGKPKSAEVKATTPK